MNKFRIAAMLAALLASVTLTTARAQSQEDVLNEISRRTGLSREELRGRARQENGVVADSGQAPPGRTALPPEIPAVILPSPSARSRTPADSARKESAAGDSTENLFGMDFFKLQAGVFSQSGFGPVPEDYLIGVGDELVVEVWGEVEFREERIVDRDGTIILPKGGKILCAGRTLGAIKNAVRERLSRSYSGISINGDEGTTFLDVTLGKLRAIRVFVVGDAVQPGAYEVSSVATIFTALYAAGGPSASGSMRDIRLVRGKETVGRLDVYDYLLSGDRSGDVLLREYDTVFIPPRAKTVVLSGSVRRPMTFELKAGEDVSDLIRFGGGFTATAASEILHVERILAPADRRPGKPDRVQMDVPMDPKTGLPRDPKMTELLDGDVVRVGTVSDRLENWVEIQGAVKRPGRYEFSEGMDAASLLDQSGRTWPDLMGQRATIDRVAPDGTYQSFDLPLAEVLEGKKVPLQPMDVVRIFSKWDLKDRFDVGISGEVRHPGTFPFREGITLRDLVLKAGGLKESADSLRAQVFRLRKEAIGSPDGDDPPQRTTDVIDVPLPRNFLSAETSFPLEPHDQVILRRLPWWQGQRTVMVTGEVLYPGPYPLESADQTLGDVIRRAGGLKPTAFVEAARLARSRDQVGNVAIDLPCALRHPHSRCDIQLFEGDEILVPERVNTVKMVGAVGYPTSVPYLSGKSLGYYVDRAGGYADGAARWKTRVVYPNGYARPIRKLWWDPPVTEGSTIVVPYKPPEEKAKPLDTIEKVIGIVASAATTIFVIDRATN